MAETSAENETAAEEVKQAAVEEPFTGGQADPTDTAESSLRQTWTRSLFGKSDKPRQYIRDRCFGNSKYHSERKPPCYPCYVPSCVFLCPAILEQNRLCECSGRVGVVDHDEPKIRRLIFTVGLVANLVAFALSFFACFAISQDLNIMRAASFSKGRIRIVNETAGSITVDVGLTAVAFAVDSTSVDWAQVISFDEFCDLMNDKLGTYVQPAQCGVCQEESGKLVSSVILSLLLIIPSITTDILRMYPNYDVNCQKFYGSIVSTVSMFFSLFTFLLYQKRCFASFYDGSALAKITPNATSSPWSFMDPSMAAPPAVWGRTLLLELDWQAGNALICMYVATSLKNYRRFGQLRRSDTLHYPGSRGTGIIRTAAREEGYRKWSRSCCQ